MTAARKRTVYLGLGTNIGTDSEKLEVLKAAVRELGLPGPNVVRVTGASSVYRTPPWGVLDQPDFFNAAVRLETALSPERLLQFVKRIEQRLGRRPTYRWGPRVLDIDILLMEDVHERGESLSIPHPRMLERDFVLVPLLEIEPEARWPDGRGIREMAKVELAALPRVGALDLNREIASR